MRIIISIRDFRHFPLFDAENVAFHLLFLKEYLIRKEEGFNEYVTGGLAHLGPVYRGYLSPCSLSLFLSLCLLPPPGTCGFCMVGLIWFNKAHY